MRNLLVIAIAALSLTWVPGAHVTSAATTRQVGCSAGLLTWFPPDGNGYAGGAGYVVEFSNIGTTACTVMGYPTVRLTENGKQVGLKSRHDPMAAVKPVRLLPGQTAHAVLLVTDAGNICRPVPTNGLRIKPPGSTPARDFRLVDFGACRGKSTLRVDAVNPGVGIPFYTYR